MNTPRANNDKRWYCIELVDEQEGLHSVLSLYADEAMATSVLRDADSRLPPSTHIYYWRPFKRPVAAPPDGYRDGPMARPDGPVTH